MLEYLNTASGYVQGAATIFAVWIAFCFAKRQMQIQNDILLKQELRQQRTQALLHTWALLQSMTFKENHRSMFLLSKNQQDQMIYSISIQRLDRWIHHDLADCFYQHNAGLLLSNAIRDALYEYRGMLYGFWLKEKSKASTEETDTWVQINNLEMIHRLEEIYNQLNAQLRQELDEIYQQFPTRQNKNVSNTA